MPSTSSLTSLLGTELVDVWSVVWQPASQHETVTKTTTKEISSGPAESGSQVTVVKTIIKTVTSSPASPPAVSFSQLHRGTGVQKTVGFYWNFSLSENRLPKYELWGKEFPILTEFKGKVKIASICNLLCWKFAAFGQKIATNALLLFLTHNAAGFLTAAENPSM